jgi:hypothetical protein
MDFAAYAFDIQKVAIDIEQFLKFLNAKGSKISQFANLHSGIIIIPNANHPMCPSASGNTDSDGDIQMSNINNLATDDRSTNNLTTLIAAAVIQALQSAHPKGHRSSLGQFTEDRRPLPLARTIQQ